MANRLTICRYTLFYVSVVLLSAGAFAVVLPARDSGAAVNTVVLERMKAKKAENMAGGRGRLGNMVTGSSEGVIGHRPRDLGELGGTVGAGSGGGGGGGTRIDNGGALAPGYGGTGTKIDDGGMLAPGYGGGAGSGGSGYAGGSGGGGYAGGGGGYGGGGYGGSGTGTGTKIDDGGLFAPDYGDTGTKIDDGGIVAPTFAGDGGGGGSYGGYGDTATGSQQPQHPRPDPDSAGEYSPYRGGGAGSDYASGAAGDSDFSGDSDSGDDKSSSRNRGKNSAATGYSGSGSYGRDYRADNEHAREELILDVAGGEVRMGHHVLLVWKGLDRGACTASGGWSGERKIRGSEYLRRVLLNREYRLTCDTGKAIHSKALVFISGGLGKPKIVRDNSVKYIEVRR